MRRLVIHSEYNRGWNDALDLMLNVSKISRFYIKILAKRNGKNVFIYLPIRRDVFNKFKKMVKLT